MPTTSFFSDMLQTISERGRRLLSPGLSKVPQGDPVQTMVMLSETLLSSRGEASGLALGRDILDRWRHLDGEAQCKYMQTLVSDFGANAQRLDQAIAAYQEDPSPAALMELHGAAEPRRQELIRRFNMAPGGIAALVAMRETLLGMKKEAPELEALDADFSHLFASWFNRGFLMLKSISWSTPANILEKIIRYEAVHDIAGWDDLRRRLAPDDRRCFAFFHPQLADDPLIFVEVALTTGIPANISDVLEEDRTPIRASEATTAVFYSISNCQAGLRGISFGNFLIKQVVEDLKRDLPKLDTFVTLSPVPGFANWLATELKAEKSDILSDADRRKLAVLDQPNWHLDDALSSELRPVVEAATAAYFLKVRNAQNRLIDPVGRFHLGNGARLEQINFLGDRSPRGLRQSHGLMVNYLYKLDDIEKNHESFADHTEVAASQAIKRLLTTDRSVKSLLSLSGGPQQDMQGQKTKKEHTA
jgi:malonyl-CoA decarboxylase